VKRFHNEDDAKKFLEKLNKQNQTVVGEGHKQHYWIEKDVQEKHQ
jgi:hypothetical protein